VIRANYLSPLPCPLLQTNTYGRMAPIAITEEARRAANLRVLQRIDPSIIGIVGSATHVVLYEFLETTQKWEKQNCEGAFCGSYIKFTSPAS
jgi:hypothetical protein